jgi:hypothetical protein
VRLIWAGIYTTVECLVLVENDTTRNINHSQNMTVASACMLEETGRVVPVLPSTQLYRFCPWIMDGSYC